ncbi:MAG: hypothetical protein V7K89_02570 [Nostoc sp.]|uniref:hypothetical protein n=1 Tax=Nostoc sp. TaxID=1180 RepID=UPI002FF8FD10
MEPVNFAKLLAQIDVEMQSLGWTREEERERLKRNYRERSRTLLAYKELLDLLQYLYLVSQPTPTLDEILIAKINVEMQRLRWTTEQGREHLKENYEKRSLTLLTEVELLDFLQYLISLPTSPLEILIAKINVETERLRQITEHRQEHLKKNYEKRSLTLLTEVELLDFLQYLVSQPTPPLDEVLIAKINVETERLRQTTEHRQEHLKKNYKKRSLTLLTEVELLDFLQYLISQPTPPLDEVLIAQTDVELQRLGWTPEQGQEHLIETYGKRSRFFLTDEELHEFLQYLKSQPDPIAGF